MKQVQLEGWHLANLHLNRCYCDGLEIPAIDQTFSVIAVEILLMMEVLQRLTNIYMKLSVSIKKKEDDG